MNVIVDNGVITYGPTVRGGVCNNIVFVVVNYFWQNTLPLYVPKQMVKKVIDTRLEHPRIIVLYIFYRYFSFKYTTMVRYREV